MNVIDLPTLSSLISLERETGKLFWRARSPDLFPSGNQTPEVNCRKWNTAFAGKEAGGISRRDGACYRVIAIFDRRYYAHRIVWALTHGRWPVGHIDHINGDPLDNRPSNLRDGNREQNMRNQKLSKANTSGVPGVFYDKANGVWIAAIQTKKAPNWRRRFSTKEEAIAARTRKAREYGFGPCVTAPRQADSL